MPSIKDAAAEFPAHKRVAVTGVSRKPENHGSNVVYNSQHIAAVTHAYESEIFNPPVTKS